MSNTETMQTASGYKFNGTTAEHLSNIGQRNMVILNIVIDVSGSMRSNSAGVISVLESLHTAFTDKTLNRALLVRITTFGDGVREMSPFVAPDHLNIASAKAEIASSPGQSTMLLGAIKEAIEVSMTYVQNMSEAVATNPSVLTFVVTDGEENVNTDMNGAPLSAADVSGLMASVRSQQVHVEGRAGTNANGILNQAQFYLIGIGSVQTLQSVGSTLGFDLTQDGVTLDATGVQRMANFIQKSVSIAVVANKSGQQSQTLTQI